MTREAAVVWKQMASINSRDNVKTLWEFWNSCLIVKHNTFNKIKMAAHENIYSTVNLILLLKDALRPLDQPLTEVTMALVPSAGALDKGWKLL